MIAEIESVGTVGRGHERPADWKALAMFVQGMLPAGGTVHIPAAPPQPGGLRVAFLLYRGNPQCGGQGVYTRHLTRELAALGHSVEVFSGPPWPELSTSIATGWRCRWSTWHQLQRAPS